MKTSVALGYRNLFLGRAPQGEQATAQAIAEAIGSGSDTVHFGQTAIHELAEASDHVRDFVNLTTDPESLNNTIKATLEVGKMLGPARFGPYADLLSEVVQ